jgi:hypothetical protein
MNLNLNSTPVNGIGLGLRGHADGCRRQLQYSVPVESGVSGVSLLFLGMTRF